MEENKNTIALEMGDKTMIAKGLNCYPRTVERVLNGQRGKNGTRLQEKIKYLAALRAEQNKKFIQVCQQLQISEMIPA